MKSIFFAEKAASMDSFNDHFRLHQTAINNSMILFPAVPASSIITFTLTEVVSWPKLLTLGQITHNLYTQLLWRKIIGISSSFPSDVDTSSIEDPHGSKITFLTREKESKKVAKSSSSLAKLSRSNNAVKNAMQEVSHKYAFLFLHT